MPCQRYTYSANKRQNQNKSFQFFFGIFKVLFHAVRKIRNHQYVIVIIDPWRRGCILSRRVTKAHRDKKLKSRCTQFCVSISSKCSSEEKPHFLFLGPKKAKSFLLSLSHCLFSSSYLLFVSMQPSWLSFSMRIIYKDGQTRAKATITMHS